MVCHHWFYNHTHCHIGMLGMDLRQVVARNATCCSNSGPIQCFFFAQSDGAAVLNEFLFGSTLHNVDHAMLTEPMRQLLNKLEVLDTFWNGVDNSYQIAADIWSGKDSSHWPALRHAVICWLTFRQLNSTTFFTSAHADIQTYLLGLFTKFYYCPERIFLLEVAWIEFGEMMFGGSIDCMESRDFRIWYDVLLLVEYIFDMIPNGFKEFRSMTLAESDLCGSTTSHNLHGCSH